MKKLYGKIRLFALLCLAALGVLGQEEQSNCASHLVQPNDSKIRFNGVLYSQITEKEAELHRYFDDFYKNGFDGSIELTRARTQRGISISFKTKSHTVPESVSMWETLPKDTQLGTVPLSRSRAR